MVASPYGLRPGWVFLLEAEWRPDRHVHECPPQPAEKVQSSLPCPYGEMEDQRGPVLGPMSHSMSEAHWDQIREGVASSSCVTLYKSHHLSDPLFSHLYLRVTPTLMGCLKMKEDWQSRKHSVVNGD